MPPSPAAHRRLRVPAAHRGNRVHPPQLHPRVPGQRGAEGEGEWARGAPRGRAGGTALLEGSQPPGEAVRGVGALFFHRGGAGAAARANLLRLLHVFLCPVWVLRAEWEYSP